MGLIQWPSSKPAFVLIIVFEGRPLHVYSLLCGCKTCITVVESCGCTGFNVWWIIWSRLLQEQLDARVFRFTLLDRVVAN